MLDKILDWLLVSSADPKQWSLAFKGALIVFTPHILNVTGILCALGVVCLGLDQGMLDALVDALGNMVFWALSIIGGVVFVVGFARKVIRSAQGNNRSLDS